MLETKFHVNCPSSKDVKPQSVDQLVYTDVGYQISLSLSNVLFFFLKMPYNQSKHRTKYDLVSVAILLTIKIL